MDTSLHCIDPRIQLQRQMTEKSLSPYIMGLQLRCSPSDVQKYIDDRNAPAYLEERVIEWLED